MASAGNPNQPPATAFDMNNLFRPSHGPNPNPSPAAPQPPFPHAGPYSYPPQTGPVFHPYLHYPPPDPAVPRPVSYPAPPPGPAPAANPTPGARLMALLGTSSSPNLDHATSAPPPPVEYSVPQPNAPILPAPIPSAPPAPPQPSPSRLPSSKLPKGRHLHGDHAVYDIDDRQPGELQPQLEVTPITKYGSDPGLVIGRQIAVNRTYICYGLKLGAIRILNINTALRSLLRGHTQRVTDMAFFADDVHLLASASVDGRVYVWKINEGPDEEDKPQITGKVIVAIQIVSNGETFHPRVCWHSHKQEILVVGIENHVLKIDTTKVGKGEIISAEEPIKCHIDKLIDGVQLVGKHEGEVTDLSICQWMTSRLASASADGTVIIWEERKAVPLVTLRPHDGQPVNSAMFLTSPHRPDHIVLITAGHLNREVKLWASSSEEGWLLPSDAESWKCIQTLELKSSADSRLEDAFFNQVVVLPRADLILLANAKKNAIYAVHIDYGSCPVATHMDYLAEFTVTMPILSLTGTSDCTSEGLHIVQVYCVQTQAIQQYALDLSQCLPSPLDPELELNHFLNGSQELLNPLGLHHESSKLPAEMSAAPRLPVTASSGGQEYPSVEVAAISVESKQPSATIDVDSVHMGSSTPLPLSPRLSGRLSGIQTPSNAFEQSQPLSEPSILERRVDAIHTNVSDVTSLDDSSRGGETKVGQNDLSVVPSSPITFRHPTHLVTPSEILSASASSERKDVQETIVNKDVESVEVEVKVVGEAGASLPGTDAVYEEKEKPIYTQVPSSDAAVTRECCALPSDIVSLEGSRQPEDVGVSFEAYESPSIAPLEGQESGKEIEGKILESSLQAESSQSALAVKGKKQKVKAIPTSGPSPPCPTDLTTDPGLCSSPSMETAFSQLLAMQETLNQVVTMQKEMQKQMSAMVAVPVNKEGRRLETALGRSMEKAVKANVDAMWARLQEENAKHEKLERDRAQQITTSITNSMNKDLPAIVEKLLKRELSTVVPNITRSITTVLEKTISSAIADSFQKGVSDKAVAQLEKSVSSKLEATVARQVQAQFQTSGKQALQEALRVSLESSVIPAFEMSCKAMFEQVDATFRKGMTEHTTSSQQQFESAHSSLATTLRDALSSATTMTQTLTGELADGQRKLLALVAAGANQKAANPLATQSSNGALAGLNDMAIFPQVEAPLDPTKELQRLISERKFGDAFTVALQRSDVSIVSWLCAQVDLQGLLAAVPSQLGQGVILSLLQQLACDLGNDTARKLEWMRDVAIAINPVDATIAIHVRPIFDQVYQILAHHQRTHPTITPAEANSLRVLMHVINSVLLSCK